jgi:hypothetical protein
MTTPDFLLQASRLIDTTAREIARLAREAGDGIKDAHPRVVINMLANVSEICRDERSMLINLRKDKP